MLRGAACPATPCFLLLLLHHDGIQLPFLPRIHSIYGIAPMRIACCLIAAVFSGGTSRCAAVPHVQLPPPRPHYTIPLPLAVSEGVRQGTDLIA
jgi:hypothetical protein